MSNPSRPSTIPLGFSLEERQCGVPLPASAQHLSERRDGLTGVGVARALVPQEALEEGQAQAKVVAVNE